MTVSKIITISSVQVELNHSSSTCFKKKILFKYLDVYKPNISLVFFNLAPRSKRLSGPRGLKRNRYISILKLVGLYSVGLVKSTFLCKVVLYPLWIPTATTPTPPSFRSIFNPLSVLPYLTHTHPESSQFPFMSPLVAAILSHHCSISHN